MLEQSQGYTTADGRQSRCFKGDCLGGRKVTRVSAKIDVAVARALLLSFGILAGSATSLAAQPVETLAWQELGERCATAIQAGAALSTEGMQPFIEPTDEVWPAFQIWSLGEVAVFQEVLATGASAPVRFCRVVLQAGADPGTTELLVANFQPWRAAQLAAGTYEEGRMRAPPEGTVRYIMDSVALNARGCRVRLEFRAQPGRPFAEFEVKERPSAACGVSGG
ncbi:MAG: hypothetical protein AAGF13_06890 [Pseudomonadota bacterium]